MEDDRAGRVDEGSEPGGLPPRRRLARFLLLMAVVVAAVLLLRGWHARSVDAQIIHRFPAGDRLLPADVEVQVWDDGHLHADAWFPRPESLADLRHTVRVPPGDYRVELTVVRTFGEPDLELIRHLTIEQPGSYYLDYELSP